MTTIREQTLDCGMTLITEQMSGVESVGVSWLLPAGIAREPVDRQGLGAIWSELLFRGAGPLDSRAQADAFDRVGANRSARSGTMFMRLGSTALGARVPELLPLIADMVCRPRMAPEAIEPSRDLALQALDSLADDPQERAAIAARLRHRPDPINRSGLGTREGLAAITREDLVDLWHAQAVPGGSILGLAGAVDHDAIAAQLDELLAGWAGAIGELRTDTVGERGYAHEEDDSNQVQILVIHDAPGESHPDAVLERIVTSVLSGGMSGRLFAEVREKRGLCYAVSAGYATAPTYGAVSSYVGTTPERAQESLDVLVEQLRRMHSAEGAVTREEFDRAVTGLTAKLVFSGESSGARASAIATDKHLVGRPRSLAERVEAIRGVTLERVNDYLSRRTLGTMTIQTLGPAPLTPPADG